MPTKNLVFIDSRVEDIRRITASLSADTAWVLLSDESDGIEQIRKAASAYSNLDSIQIVSHGSAANLYLGNTTLNGANLSSYAKQLNSIGSHLSASGDILLYGCDVGATDKGQAFVSELSKLTGADVAASSDKTGFLGTANWNLEVASGTIETAALTVQGYDHVLGTITGTDGNDTLNGTGENDIIDGGGGNDSIDGGAGHDSLIGGSGNDIIDGSFGNDTLIGGEGNDTLRDDQGSNSLDGGAGSDSLFSQSLTGEHTLNGGSGNDNINATGKKLVLSGGTDDDSLSAGGVLSSPNGQSWVQHGIATLSGGDGSDNLSATQLSNALLQGDEGDDNLYVSALVHATLEGGGGNDRLNLNHDSWINGYVGEGLGQSFVLDGGSGDDVLGAYGTSGYWYGKVNVDLRGGAGNDQLELIDYADATNGGVFKASLDGGDGDDKLTASGVLDLTMTGGSGRDTFVLTSAQYKTAQVTNMGFYTEQQTSANAWTGSPEIVNGKATVITDFKAGNNGDILEIKDLLQNAAVSYDGTNPFASGYLKLEQSGADTLVKFDADGTAGTVKSFVTVAVLTNVNAGSLTSDNLNPKHSPDGLGAAGQLYTGTVSNDIIIGAYGDDTINGNAGNDSLDGQAGFDLIHGGTGNDTIDGGFGNDSIYGDSGNDTLRDDQGSNLLDGGGGNDTLTTSSLTGQHTLMGGYGNDNLNATGARVVLDGGDDDDSLSAGGVLSSPNGQSWVQHGIATLSGGDGSDNLSATQLSNALLQGDEGDDNLYVSALVHATLEGGGGNDRLNLNHDSWINGYVGEGLGQSFVLDGGSGDDVLGAYGTSGYWYGKVNVDLRGGAGNDQLELIDYADATNGGVFKASLDGGDGDDKLTASGVLDLTMTGGSGRDTFVLTSAQYKTAQVTNMGFYTEQQTSANAWTGSPEIVNGKATVITDFKAGNNGDILEIKDLLQNAAVSYDGTNPFASGYLKLEQSGADTLVKFDADGTAGTVKSFVTVAVLTNVNAGSLTSDNLNPKHSPDGLGAAGQLYTGTVSNDIIIGAYGDDTINGNAGNDSLDGQAGFDLIHGGTGNDTIDGGFGNDSIYGDSGNDTLRDDQGSNLLDGGGGNDTLTTSSLTGQHTLMGGYGNDNLNATGARVVLDGGDDDDSLSAGGVLSSPNGQSWVQHGIATLSGGDGSDNLSATQLSNALLQGDEGDDNLYVSALVHATLEGGGGNDRLNLNHDSWINGYVGEGLGQSFVLDGGSGDDVLGAYGTSGYWYGKVNVDLRGGAGNDQLELIDYADATNGGVFKASLDGGDGDDKLTASGVLDLTMTGGSGRDTFVLTSAQYKTAQVTNMGFYTEQQTSANAWTGSPEIVNGKATVITDFKAGNNGDILEIKDLLQNAAVSYDGTNPFASGYLKLEQSGADTLVKFDADGTAGTVKSFVTVAVLTNVNAAQLTASNFYPAFGTPNSDYLEGTPGADILNGIEGNDTLTSGGGADSLDGGVGNDSLDGGTGNDSLTGGTGADTLVGGGGSDSVTAGTGDDQMISGAGNDTYAGGDGQDILFMGSDDSTIDMGSGTASGSTEGSDSFSGIEAIDAGAGNDTVTGSAGVDSIFGGSGNDSINGGGGNDELVGGTGDDTLNGGIGFDCAEYVSSHSDLLINLLTGTASGADIGTDTLFQIEEACAGSGNDKIVAGNTNNLLEGGAGNDTLVGGTGTDTLVGGDGVDQISYADLTNAVVVDLSGGTATGTSSGNDSLESIENVVGSQGADSITGSAADNNLEGGLGNDTLTGGDGNDTLYSGSGDDTVYGGEGADFIVGGDGAGNDRYDGGNGVDTVKYTSAIAGIKVDLSTGAAGSLSTTTVDAAGIGNDTLMGIENIIAGNFGDSIVGSAAANRLDGLAGNDTLNGGAGVDTLVGGIGDDTYVVDNLSDVVTEAQGEGTDLVQVAIATANGTYVLGANVENGMLTNAVAYTLTGNELNNALKGNGASNTLNGGAGNDTLDGGAGADALVGGAGDDTYVVDNGLDTVTEALNQGTDTVQIAIATASGTYTLGTNVENGTLTNTVAYTLWGNALNNVLKGNTASNTLNGGAGNDTLDGGAGADSLVGGTGDDTYVVDNLSDVVTEAQGEGTDLVQIAIATANGTYVLGANVENGTLTNTVAYILSGNELNNVLKGNTASNTLNGGAGNDILDGGAGADSLAGGTGDDTYVVDNALDTVTEVQGEGTDMVQSSVSYVLSNYVEVLSLTGTAAINATGNELNNALTGNAANNVLDGLGGSDVLIGGAGIDTFKISSGIDTVGDLGNGADILMVSVGATANVSMAAAWTATAATVNNGTVNINTNGFAVNLAAATGTMGFNVTNVGTASSSGTTLTGSSLANTLTSGAGTDTLIGGAGDDTYVVNSKLDVVTETATGGTDMVKLAAGVSTPYILAANVENLQLMDAAGASGATGNAMNNVIFMNGNTGNSAIDGGLGVDTLSYQYAVFAGAGAATGVTLNLGVLTNGNSIASGGFGNDLIKGIENLVGSAYADTLTGNSGANVLAGGMGRDVLTGGLGADKYLFNVMETSANKDTIADFNVSEDKIQFSKAVFAGLNTANGSTADMALMFARSTDTMSASTRLIYDSKSGILSYDADGSGAQFQAVDVALIGVNTHAQLAASHFEIVA